MHIQEQIHLLRSLAADPGDNKEELSEALNEAADTIERMATVKLQKSGRVDLRAKVLSLRILANTPEYRNSPVRDVFLEDADIIEQLASELNRLVHEHSMGIGESGQNGAN